MRYVPGILVLGALLAGCAGSTGGASSAPPIASPAPVASDAPPSTTAPEPVLTPVPSAEASIAPSGSAAAAPDLLAGLRADLAGTCAASPLDPSTGADAQVTCTPQNAAESVTLLRFASVDALLEAYFERVDANGIPRRSHGGSCATDVASEGAYTPGDEGPTFVAERDACYVDETGKARYLATIAPWVLVEATGTGGDPVALRTWAWQGNQDAPGSPTIWLPRE